MDRRTLAKLNEELTEFVDEVFDGIGRRERRENLGLYVTGLLLDGERKSIEPIAGRLVEDAAEIEGMRQRLQQAVSVADWREDVVFHRLARKVDGELPGIEVLVIDDTGYPKKGTHSVGVARQYSGTLGRVDNCQVAVSLHLAGEQGSACIAMRLFLPEAWTSDRARCRAVGVPEEIGYATKHEIALAQIDAAFAAGVRRHVALADAGYGDSTEFRTELTSRGLQYVVGISGVQVVWPPESRPRIPTKTVAIGRPRRKYKDDRHPPIAINELAAMLRYRHVSWRDGSRGRQSSRFAAARVRTAHHHSKGYPPGDEQWLLCQWLDDEPAPTKFWLATLPATASLRMLIRFAKLRWRVERDYQEMKQEVGLDHFEGRTWRGFHHHAALCAIAHGFLALTRALFPPEADPLDAADGPSLPAGHPLAPARNLSAMPSPDHSSSASDGGVAHVIESY